MIKTVINFEDIKAVVSAADHMQCAGKHEEAKKILLSLADDLKEALK